MPIEATMWTRWKMNIAAGVICGAGMMASEPAQALVSGCSAVQTFVGPWTNVAPSTGGWSNGTVVLRTTSTIEVRFTVTQGDTYQTSGSQVSSGYLGPPMNATTFTAFPGVGLRVTHMSTRTVSGATQITEGSRGTVGSGVTNLSSVVVAPGTYVLSQTWRYELLIHDVNAYVERFPNGANMSGAFHSHNLGATFVSAPPGGSCPSRAAGFFIFDPNAPAGSRPDIPVVPPPPEVVIPTCDFATLNQTVALRPADRDDVAPSGSARSAGEAGEVGFDIVGTACGAGASLKIFTTDAKNHSNTTSNLTLSTGDVNLHRMAIRLYHDKSTTPLTFGPAPTANDLGGANHVAITVPTAGTVTVPFTAQYVRLPGFNATDLQPGPVAAAAFVTIIYP